MGPVRGWAATAHIPALRALPNYEIRALSAHSAESARAAGNLFGVGAVFTDHEQLVTQQDVDVVAVTVKVPHHRELVSAALAAGKAVFGFGRTTTSRARRQVRQLDIRVTVTREPPLTGRPIPRSAAAAIEEQGFGWHGVHGT